MMEIKEQPGYLPEMEGMEKVFDRDEHPGLVTGDRAHYKAKMKGPCDRCGAPTNKVIDYLGSLGFLCGPICPKPNL